MTKKRRIATLKISPDTALLPLELYNENALRFYKGNLHQISKSILNGNKGCKGVKNISPLNFDLKYHTLYYSIETYLDTE